MRKLREAIRATGNPSVVGLDPTDALLPAVLLRDAGSLEDKAEAYYAFNCAIIDAVADIVPAVKPQIAMYEALGPAGVAVYARTNAYAQAQGLYVLGDIKRGDIGSTAAAYAAHLRLDAWHEDAVTVNPYLGSDGITPFVDAAEEYDKDIFVLAKTSNPSSRELQDLPVSDKGMTLAEHVGGLIEQWGGASSSSSSSSSTGYSRVGAVVGATHPEAGAQLRALMPHTFFLVPGYGAQGGTAAGLAGFFDSAGSGALINSSRGIIGAWRARPEAFDGLSTSAALEMVGTAAREAAVAMREDITTALRERTKESA
ncbi:orotidine-5'-phosphate decarboxylase [Alloscardovia macacae]|uniref:Orotidine 5'-phosphate decarboxylase n=1 Tax=Alloscardovia macacae TaxID=1160091 RepID=A0A1Y2T062_9BIFI|nr:orotidine-5'-phosphate decarboxylase [Alloscardovia macacae]OTA30142.1 orotidine-5'-phosphate decarboxylase [Alloscardovia macacae]